MSLRAAASDLFALQVSDTYGYDQFNNRRTRQPNSGSAYHYLYDSAQQLNEIRSGSDTGTIVASFGYDDSGNMVNKSDNGVSRTLTYDAQERLVQVSGSNISTETYAYDHEGRRIEKTSGGTTNRYLYSGPSIWSEYGSSWGTALAHYTYTGLDKRIIRSTASDASYYHNDGLGSVVAVSNTAGATQASTRFDAWGSVIASTGSTPFGFTGREKDATGLGYFRARYYDSTMGRFTQRDPIGFRGGLNPYAYVGNSPQNFTDPLGLIQRPVTEMIGWESSYNGYSNSERLSAFGPFGRNELAIFTLDVNGNPLITPVGNQELQTGFFALSDEIQMGTMIHEREHAFTFLSVQEENPSVTSISEMTSILGGGTGDWFDLDFFSSREIGNAIFELSARVPEVQYYESLSNPPPVVDTYLEGRWDEIYDYQNTILGY